MWNSAEHSWALKARQVTNAVLGLTEFMCDLVEQSWVLIVVHKLYIYPHCAACSLEIRGFVCDLAEQSWAAKAVEL